MGDFFQSVLCGVTVGKGEVRHIVVAVVGLIVRGACVGHISPEAAVGGPIALVEDGDIIEINIPENTITLNVSDEELAKRRAAWKPREPKITTGYLARYAKLVSSGAQGAVLS